MTRFWRSTISGEDLENTYTTLSCLGAAARHTSASHQTVKAIHRGDLIFG